MNHCFRILGLHPIAAPTTLRPEFKREIRKFYIKRNYDKILDLAESYKSFEDRPWNMWEMYRRIDQRFPDSLFILTIRDVDSWWRSTERWVKVQKPHIINRYQLHLGADKFDKESMTKKYIEYNEDVIRYFKGTDKLLIMDLEKGDGWDKLCVFLEVPVPKLPFPHANRQAYTPEDKKTIKAFKRQRKGITCQACQHVFHPSKKRNRKEETPPLHRAAKKPSIKTHIKHKVARQVRKIQKNNLLNHLFYYTYNTADHFIKFISNDRKKQRAKIEKLYPDLKTNNLAVVSCLFNPNGSQRRLNNFKKFVEEIHASGVHCLIVELAFGTRPFMMSSYKHVIQLRTNDVMWHKERLLNIGIKQLLSEGYEKIAWLDGDIVFKNPDWPWVVAAQLESAQLCQVFSTVSIQRGSGLPPQRGGSAVKYFMDHNKLFSQPPVFSWGVAWDGSLGGQSGFGWAARAEVFQQVLLFENAIVGGADKMMLAASLAEKSNLSELAKLTVSHIACPKCAHRNRSDLYTSNFINWVRQWSVAVGNKVNYAPLQIRDMYHGSRANRKYMSRRNILFKHQYNPAADLSTSPSGCLAWGSKKTELHQDVESYFSSRQEDS